MSYTPAALQSYYNFHLPAGFFSENTSRKPAEYIYFYHWKPRFLFPADMSRAYYFHDQIRKLVKAGMTKG